MISGLTRSAIGEVTDPQAQRHSSIARRHDPRIGYCRAQACGIVDFVDWCTTTVSPPHVQPLLEHGAAMTNHAPPRIIQFYGRRSNKVTLDKSQYARTCRHVRVSNTVELTWADELHAHAVSTCPLWPSGADEDGPTGPCPRRYQCRSAATTTGSSRSEAIGS